MHFDFYGVFMRYKTNEGDNICANCKHGKDLFSGDAVLCKRHGIVKPTATCRRFVYDPLKRDVKPLPKLPGLYLPPED